MLSNTSKVGLAVASFILSSLTSLQFISLCHKTVVPILLTEADPSVMRRCPLLEKQQPLYVSASRQISGKSITAEWKESELQLRSQLQEIAASSVLLQQAGCDLLSRWF